MLGREGGGQLRRRIRSSSRCAGSTTGFRLRRAPAGPLDGERRRWKPSTVRLLAETTSDPPAARGSRLRWSTTRRAGALDAGCTEDGARRLPRRRPPLHRVLSPQPGSPRARAHFAAFMRPYAPDKAISDDFVRQWFFDRVIHEYRLDDPQSGAAGERNVGGRRTGGTPAPAGMLAEVAATRGERSTTWRPAPAYRDARTTVVLALGRRGGPDPPLRSSLNGWSIPTAMWLNSSARRRRRSPRRPPLGAARRPTSSSAARPGSRSPAG